VVRDLEHGGSTVRLVGARELRSTLLGLELDRPKITPRPVEDEVLELEIDRLARAQKEVHILCHARDLPAS
jgi:hypothetical protein